MKKKLVVLLAVVMMFAFAATAYAVDFSDISEQPVTVQDAIAKTTALGIIEGYTDGTFGPEQNITRAEFAKIAVTAAGAKDTAAMLEKNASSFKDVKAGVWYTGWINASESLGIFQGDGNGNFRPNDSISNQEVVTVLMRLLGYNDNLTGTWPTNYITQANKIGILDDVAIVASAAAKRADVVVMLDDTLDSNIVTYDKSTNEFVDKQNEIAGSKARTLLDDSFKGQVVEYSAFNKIDQVRDAAAETLTWTVGTKKDVNEKIPYDTLIIDKDTKVSHNAASLFDLQYHQGKVYYVKDGSKYYARFIEVKSYTKTSSDPTKVTATVDDSTTPSIKYATKVTVNKTNYNVASNVKEAEVNLYEGDKAKPKNSNYVLYFNSDDQLYKAISDKEFTEQAYYVKSVGTATVKLVNVQNGGVKTTTVNMKDGDTLIWNGKEFIAPSELKAGDAVMEITPDDLYVKIDEATGELTKTNDSNASPRKATIGGKTYVFTSGQYIDDQYDAAGVEDDDVLGNNVKYILNKDNSIAAILVDETSTGTKLYGIVVEGGKKGTTGGLTEDSGDKDLKNLTIFTAEGKEVTYDLDLGKSYNNDKGKMAEASVILGRMVEYQLNKDGEIKELKVLYPDAKDLGETHKGGTNLLKLTAATEAEKVTKVEVKNNSYLKGVKNITLASNVVIFEVGVDDGYIDPSIVTRAQLLAGGDFTPEALGTDTEKIKGLSSVGGKIDPYAIYVTNSNGAAKALAYTSGEASRLNFAVIDSYRFHNSDGDDNLTFKGDDTIYEYSNGTGGGDGKLVVYTLSGSKVDIKAAYDKKPADTSDLVVKDMKYLSGWSDGLMTFAVEMEPNFVNGKDNTTGKEIGAYENIMTDVDTQVYVLDANTGNYNKGSVEDIYKGAYVFVAAVDDDNVAELVIVNEWTNYNKVNVESTIKVESGAEIKYDSKDNTKITITLPSSAVVSKFSELETYVKLGDDAKIKNGDGKFVTIEDETAIKVGETYTIIVTPANGSDDITCTITIEKAPAKGE